MPTELPAILGEQDNYLVGTIWFLPPQDEGKIGSLVLLTYEKSVTIFLNISWKKKMMKHSQLTPLMRRTVVYHQRAKGKWLCHQHIQPGNASWHTIKNKSPCLFFISLLRIWGCYLISRLNHWERKMPSWYKKKKPRYCVLPEVTVERWWWSKDEAFDWDQRNQCKEFIYWIDLRVNLMWQIKFNTYTHHSRWKTLFKTLW